MFTRFRRLHVYNQDALTTNKEAAMCRVTFTRSEWNSFSDEDMKAYIDLHKYGVIILVIIAG